MRRVKGVPAVYLGHVGIMYVSTRCLGTVAHLVFRVSLKQPPPPPSIHPPSPREAWLGCILQALEDVGPLNDSD